MSLQEQQHLFWSLARGEGDPRAVEASFHGTPDFDAHARVALYRSMFVWRQLDALADAFPRTLRVLGGARFRDLGERYVAACPSEDPRLERLGRKLPAFLAASEHVEERRVADLAELEWARTRAFLAPDPEQVAAVSAIDPATFADARLELVPAFALVSTRTDAAALWEAAEIEGAVVDFEALARPSRAAVARRGFTVFHVPLDDDEGEALASAVAGAPMGEVCAAFAGAADPARRAWEVIGRWFSRGFVARVGGSS